MIDRGDGAPAFGTQGDAVTVHPHTVFVLPERMRLGKTGVEMLLVYLPRPIFGTPIGPYACSPASANPAVDAGSQVAWNREAWEELARDGRADVHLVVRDGDWLPFRVE